MCTFHLTISLVVTIGSLLSDGRGSVSIVFFMSMLFSLTSPTIIYAFKAERKGRSGSFCIHLPLLGMSWLFQKSCNGLSLISHWLELSHEVLLPREDGKTGKRIVVIATDQS